MKRIARRLTGKMERFAASYVETGNAVLAYRAAYKTETMLPATIKREAHTVLHIPAVEQRVRELQRAAAERSLITVAELMQQLEDIATADPTELVQVAGTNCRWCWGIDGEHQWRSPEEFAAAVQRAAVDKRPAPNDLGGYGFRGDREPNPSCARCDGAGISTVQITPTSQLSRQGRRLFKSARQNRHGEIIVEMQDQNEDRVIVALIKPAYTTVSVSASVSLDPSKPSPWSAEDLTPEQVLARVRRLRPPVAVIESQDA